MKILLFLFSAIVAVEKVIFKWLSLLESLVMVGQKCLSTNLYILLQWKVSTVKAAYPTRKTNRNSLQVARSSGKVSFPNYLITICSEKQAENPWTKSFYPRKLFRHRPLYRTLSRVSIQYMDEQHFVSHLHVDLSTKSCKLN